MEAEKSCCFIGLHIHSLIFIFNEEAKQSIRLKQIMSGYIIDLIKHHSVTNFISDMSLGFDVYAAEMILSLKPEYPDITLECVLPYEEQAAHWTTNQRNKYFNIMEKCDNEIILQKHYTSTCNKMNEKYMIDNSAFILVMRNRNNPGNIIQYIKSKNRQITLINPDEL